MRGGLKMRTVPWWCIVPGVVFFALTIGLAWILPLYVSMHTWPFYFLVLFGFGLFLLYLTSVILLFGPMLLQNVKNTKDVEKK